MYLIFHFETDYHYFEQVLQLSVIFDLIFLAVFPLYKTFLSFEQVPGCQSPVKNSNLKLTRNIKALVLKYAWNYVLIGSSYAMADCKMYISNNYSNSAVSGMVQLVWSGLQLRQIFQCFSVRMIVIVRLPSLNCE